MTNQNKIVNILNTYGAMNSKQCANLINREYGGTITPAQVAGAIRPMVGKGIIANSKDAYGKGIYWLTDFGKETCKQWNSV